MGTLSAQGTCTEAKWPYVPSQVFTRPSWGSYRQAFANKIGAFYRITSAGSSRHADIIEALKREHPVVFGVFVGKSFMNLGPDGNVKIIKNEVLEGAHAMLIVGVDGRGNYIVRNSWGDSWGDKGYCYMPYAYLDEYDADDFWVATLAPTHV
jgi:C1A family cysteine protease